MSVSIVIPNYNGKQLLEKNLPKLIAELDHEKVYKCEIVIVDDGSTDDSQAFLEALKKTDHSIQMTVLKNEKNHGFSFTVNKGVREAKGEIVLLLNTDIYPQGHFLQPLLQHFSDPSVFAVGCMDKSIEGQEEILRGRGIGKWERGFLMHSKGDIDKTNTLWASGGSSAFRKNMWETLGGFNTLYNPFYWEDIDLSYRALKAGYAVLFEKKSVVVHEHEKGAIKSHYSKDQVKTIAYRNQFFIVWLNITDISKIISHVLWLPYHIITAVLRGDFALLKGFFSALLSFLDVLDSRRKNTTLFKKTDTDILNMFSE